MAVAMNAYLLEAWINLIHDFGASPYIIVNTEFTERVMELPVDALSNTSRLLTLNIAANATGFLKIDKENGYISFSTRINKISYDFLIPIEAIEHMHSHDGKIVLDMPDKLVSFTNDNPDNNPTKKDPPTKPTTGKPKLSIVK